MRELCVENVKNILESLDSSRFEKICYIFIDYITSKKLLHRGENIKGDAVGYTVDSYSDDGQIVGEYSVDKKYFMDLKKPEEDIKHAYKNFPNLKQIYLCAGIAATSSQGINMANLCGKYKKNYKISINWYDSRQISEIITDEIINKNVILNKMIEIAPDLAKAIGENNLKSNIPELPENYSFLCTTSNFLLEKLEKNHFLYLHGISGIGKTMFSVYLQKELSKKVQVDNLEFINVSKVGAMEELRQFKDPIFGYGVDLLNTMYNDNSIFILDDLSKDINKIVTEIMTNVGMNSYVIITSQLACQTAQSKQLAFEMENLDFDTASKVFSYGMKNPGTEEQMKLLYSKTAGYPILLNTIRSLMQYDGLKWEELEDQLTYVPDYEVEEGIKLTKKLLKRHQEVLSKELLAIYWLKTNYISRTLLKKLISLEGIRKLKARSFLQESSEVIKIHDIVYSCIESLTFETEKSRKITAYFHDIFYKALEEGIKSKDADYYRILHLHENKILSIAQESSALGMETYFYLQAFPNDERNILKEYSEGIIKELIQNIKEPYVYRSIIEWYELNLRKMKEKDSENFFSQAQIYIDNLGHMLSGLNKKDNLYIDLLHHQGKMYHNINKDSIAQKCFEEVLQLNPNAYETKLQIARIYKAGKKKECIALYKEILDYYISGGKISMSVVLAAYEDIAFYLDAEMKELYFIKHYDAFKEAIISLSGTSYDQPYIVLANISKVYTYDHPDNLKQLLDKLHLPSIEKIDKRNYFSIAKMYMEFGKALRNLEKNSEEAENYIKIAEYYFEKIDDEMHWKSFSVVQRAESFLLLKKYDEALQFLNKHVFEEEAFWWYRKSCAFLWSDKYLEAQECCDKALELIKSKSDGDRFISTFYRKRAQIAFYCQEGEKKILNFLNLAIEKCNDSKYNAQLMMEMSIYQKENKLEKD